MGHTDEPPGYDPAEFRAKIRSLGVIGRRSGDRVTYGRDEKGYRTKATLDELGNTVTEHADPTDRVDVNIRPPHVKLRATVEEIRQT